MSFERHPTAKATTTTSRPVVIKPAETVTYPAAEPVLKLSNGPDGSAGWRLLVNGVPDASAYGPTSEHEVGYLPSVFQKFGYAAPVSKPVSIDAIYTLRGLVPGRKYTVGVQIQADNADLSITLNAGGVASVAYLPGPFDTRKVFHQRSVTFTAATDEEDVIIRVVRPQVLPGPGEHTMARFADFTVTGMLYTRTIPAVLSDQVAFPIHEGSMSLDAAWSPYVQASVRVPMPTPDADTQFDPNKDTRFKVTASSIRSEVAQWTGWSVARRNYHPDADLTGGSYTLPGGRGTAWNPFQLLSGSTATDARNVLFARQLNGVRDLLVSVCGLRPGERFGIAMPITETTPPTGGALAVGIWPNFTGPQAPSIAGTLHAVLRVRNTAGTVLLSREWEAFKDGSWTGVDRYLEGVITTTTPSSLVVEAYLENRGTVALSLPANMTSTPLSMDLSNTHKTMEPALYLNDAIPKTPWPDNYISTLATANDSTRYVRGARSTTRQTRTPLTPVVSVIDESVFDLALTSREIDYAAGEMTLELASDEYLAQRYAPIVDDKTPRARESSLRSVCEYVLGKAIPTVPVLGGTADAAVPATWDAENLCINPSAETNTTGWTAGANATSLVRSTGQVGGTEGVAAFRWTTGAAGISYIDMDRISVREGDIYTVSGYFVASVARNVSIMVRVLDAQGRIIRESAGPATAITTLEWTRVSHTITVPTGGAAISCHLGYQASAAGQNVWMDRFMITAGPVLLPYFSGDTAPTADYAYAWSGGAHASASVRTALKPRDPDALTWHAGQTAWDFLTTLANSVGLRLYCDETRTWWLVNPATHTRTGSISATSATTIEAEDRTDGERGDYADGVVITWKWKDQRGEDRIQVETAGTAGKVDTLELGSPYPGAGTAAARLATLQRRATERPITVASDFRARPAQAFTSAITGAPTRTGRIGSVRLDLASGLMLVQPDKLA